jgi:hypothetical protein
MSRPSWDAEVVEHAGVGLGRTRSSAEREVGAEGYRLSMAKGVAPLLSA